MLKNQLKMLLVKMLLLPIFLLLMILTLTRKTRLKSLLKIRYEGAKGKWPRDKIMDDKLMYIKDNENQKIIKIINFISR